LIELEIGKTEGIDWVADLLKVLSMGLQKEEIIWFQKGT